jgi:hypothetical protein
VTLKDTAGPSVIAGNTITGKLACSGNAPAPVDRVCPTRCSVRPRGSARASRTKRHRRASHPVTSTVIYLVEPHWPGVDEPTSRVAVGCRNETAQAPVAWESRGTAPRPAPLLRVPMQPVPSSPDVPVV